MRVAIALFTLLGLFHQLVGAALVQGNITFPQDATINDKLQTKIDLRLVSENANDFNKKEAFIKRDGTFELVNIPEGSYLLTVSSIKYNLIPFKLKVNVDESDNVLVNAVLGAQRFSEASLRVPHPIQYIVNPKQPNRNYIKNRVGGVLDNTFVGTIINNPLYLTGALFAIGIVLAPYILEKFDPEIAKLVKEQKAQKNNTVASKEAVEELQKSAKTVEEKEKEVETIEAVGAKKQEKKQDITSKSQSINNKKKQSKKS